MEPGMKITRRSIGRDTGLFLIAEGDITDQVSANNMHVTTSLYQKNDQGTTHRFDVEIGTDELLLMLERKLNAAAKTTEARAIAQAAMAAIRTLTA